MKASQPPLLGVRASLVPDLFPCLLFQPHKVTIVPFLYSLLLVSDYSVQLSLSVVSDSLRPRGLQHARPPLTLTNSGSLLRLMSFESVMPSNHSILCHPLILPPSIFPSIRVFSNESALCIRWPKFQLQHQSFQ